MSSGGPTLVFMHTAWMDRYEGEEDQPPRGGGSFVSENGWGGELFNFRDEDGYVYGYVSSAGDSINIDRLGADTTDDCIDDVYVIWTATHPEGGVRIAGWYENATVHRSYQFDTSLDSRMINGRYIVYIVKARSEDAWLLPSEMRDFPIKVGKGWMGQANVWYADRPEREEFRADVLAYLQNQRSILLKPHRSSPMGARDIHNRYEAEQAAVQVVSRYFERSGYVVRSVESDNVGWDLEASKGKELLRLEVKGLSGDAITVQLTPNEYEQMREQKSSYRICVVTRGLELDPSLWVFAYVDGYWENVVGKKVRLQITEQTSAVLTRIHP